jgi:hypothetical protein
MNTTMLMQANRSEYRQQQDNIVTDSVNSLSRDSNILQDTVQRGVFDFDKDKLIIRRRLYHLKSEKPIDNIQEFEELRSLIDSDSFEKTMLTDPEFFKFIYNHPLLIYHEKYMTIKESYKDMNIKLITERMKDNRDFSFQVTVNEFKQLMVDSDDEDEEYDDGFEDHEEDIENLDDEDDYDYDYDDYEDV